MSYLSASPISCGVYLMNDLYGGAVGAIRSAFEQSTPRLISQVVFSDVVGKASAGTALAKHILDKNLGTITASRIKVNPNTGNRIRVWVWELNVPNLEKWLNKHAKA